MKNDGTFPYYVTTFFKKYLPGQKNLSSNTIHSYSDSFKLMQVFQSANPGVASRIGFTFDFPDYTPDELTQMFYMKMRRNGFMLDETAVGCVNKVMEYFSKMEDFGNGRFVDKIIDMTINNRAMRAYAQKYYNDITDKDIPEIRDIIRISSKGQALWTDEEQSDSMRRRIAIHEVGHAVVSRIACPEIRIAMVSINADAASMGKAVIEMDSNNLTETRYNISKMTGQPI